MRCADNCLIHHDAKISCDLRLQFMNLQVVVRIILVHVRSHILVSCSFFPKNHLYNSSHKALGAQLSSSFVFMSILHDPNDKITIFVEIKINGRETKWYKCVVIYHPNFK